MPTKSLYPDLEIPEVDIWTFLFERESREYPNDKCKCPRARLRDSS